MNAQLQHAPTGHRNHKNRSDHQHDHRPAKEVPFTPITAMPVHRPALPAATARADGEFSPMAYDKAAGAVQVTPDGTLASMLAYAAKALRERDALMDQLRQAMAEDSHPMEHMVAREWRRRMAAAGVVL